MNKQDLVEALSARLQKSQREASETIDALVDEIKKALEKGEAIRISGFGAFEQTVRSARQGRNPRTGEPVKISATRVVRFRPAADFKAIVAGTRKAVAAAVPGGGEAPASSEPVTVEDVPVKATAARKAPARRTAAKTATAAKKAAPATKAAPAKKAAAAKKATAAKKAAPAKKTTPAKSAAAKKAAPAKATRPVKKATASAKTTRAAGAAKPTTQVSRTAAKRAPSKTGAAAPPPAG